MCKCEKNHTRHTHTHTAHVEESEPSSGVANRDALARHTAVLLVEFPPQFPPNKGSTLRGERDRGRLTCDRQNLKPGLRGGLAGYGTRHNRGDAHGEWVRRVRSGKHRNCVRLVVRLVVRRVVRLVVRLVCVERLCVCFWSTLVLRTCSSSLIRMLIARRSVRQWPSICSRRKCARLSMSRSASSAAASEREKWERRRGNENTEAW